MTETLELIAWLTFFIIFSIAFFSYFKWRSKKRPELLNFKHNHPFVWEVWSFVILAGVLLIRLNQLNLIHTSTASIILIVPLLCAMGYYTYLGMSKKDRCPRCNLDLKMELVFIGGIIVLLILPCLIILMYQQQRTN